MAQVGCAGILVSDTFCGPMQELPREGQLLVVEGMPTRPGGCAANVAIDLSKQGIAVDISGCLGNDPSAKVLLASYEEYGIGCNRIVYSNDWPTSKTVILLVDGQDRRYIHSFGANTAFTVGHINRDWVRSLKVFYLGGLLLLPSFYTEELLDLLAFCRTYGVVTVVDVVIPQNASISKDLGSLLRLIDFFLPNDDEARLLTGLADPQEQLRFFLEQGANNVFITLGSHGVLVGRGGDYWKAGVYEMNHVDPSGSGDAFDAGVVLGALRGWDMSRTIHYASALGASAIRAIGTTDGVFTSEQVEEFISVRHLEIEQGKL